MRCMRKTLPKIERYLEDRRRTRRVPRGTSILRAAALFVLMLACLPAFGCRRETPQHIVLDLLPETAEPAVRQPTPTPDPPFYLNVTESTIYGGGVCQLVAYENPGAMECRTVRWRSENEDVAIVEAYGVVIGLAPGTARIIAEANNGSGETAVCNVTVTSARPAPNETPALSGNCYEKEERLRTSAEKRIRSMAKTLDRSTAGGCIAAAALGYVGTPYGTKEGNIDCSMLLLYACLDNGLRLPRRSDWQAAAMESRAIALHAVQPGDLLFFAYPEETECTCKTAPLCTRHLGVHHSAVYLGEANGVKYVVEASSRIGKVIVRVWGGTERHAGMRLVLAARPAREVG